MCWIKRVCNTCCIMYWAQSNGADIGVHMEFLFWTSYHCKLNDITLYELSYNCVLLRKTWQRLDWISAVKYNINWMAALSSWCIHTISIYGYKVELGSLNTWSDQNIVWLVPLYRWCVISFRLFNVIPYSQHSNDTDIPPNVAYKPSYQMDTDFVSLFVIVVIFQFWVPNTHIWKYWYINNIPMIM